MKLAVDVCIGKAGIAELERAGYEVVVAARGAETDRSWFTRALQAGATVVIAMDRDLEILCYDHRVSFLRVKHGISGKANALRAIQIMRRWGPPSTGMKVIEGRRPKGG